MSRRIGLNMEFIQSQDKNTFISTDQIESIYKIDEQWYVTTTKNISYKISDYTLSWLVEWPHSFIYWSDKSCKEEFEKKYNRLGETK